MKRFVVIGLGSFGTAVATRLSENDCRVTAIDMRRERVEEMQDVVYEAMIGDCTDRETLEALGLDTAEAIVISLGADISTSLLATLHVRELHGRRIIVKGVSPEHGKILEYLGVERVVFPKLEVGQFLADRLTWPNMIDFLPIGSEYGVDELSVPDGLIGKTLRQSDLRGSYGVYVLGVKDGRTDEFELLPHADFELQTGQVILVVGEADALKRLRELK